MLIKYMIYPLFIGLISGLDIVSTIGEMLEENLGKTDLDAWKSMEFIANENGFRVEKH